MDIDRLAAATDLLSHRGPDGGAYWADGPFFLGHRRLAIIDLSAHGDQPMAAGSDLVIAFNGELYNYPELRDELAAKGHTFRTASDTEVVLRAFLEWDRDMLPRLRGMFAFGIADRRDGSLFVARDRFGEKPLFLHEDRAQVTFSSELRSLAALMEHRSVDPAALGAYLCLNYVPGEKSMLAGVERLPPGTWKKLGPGTVTSAGRYYDPGTVQIAVPAQLEPTLDELRTRLDHATKIALRADVPVALFLSGGLDSSLTAESATRQGRLSDAYCLDIAERSYSEWGGAELVASRLGLNLHRVVLTHEVLGDFESIADHADDPLGDSSALAVWQLSREVAKKFKVVISGDGGDELLGGYLTYKATRIFQSSLERAPPALRFALARWSAHVRPGQGKVTTLYKAKRFLRAAHLPAAEAHFTFNGAFMPDVAMQLVTGDMRQGAARDAIMMMRARHGLGDRPGLWDLQRADATDYLPNDILTKVDRMTMAHGLESRAPLLDVDLADFAMSAAHRYEGSMLAKPKRLFRELARRRFGPAVADARKQGFSIPVHSWLREKHPAIVGDFLSRATLDKVPVLDAAAVEAVRDRFLAGEQLGFEVWGLCVFVAWYRSRIAAAPAKADTRLRRVSL